MGMEESQDLWRSADKGYHVLFCFSLSLVFSLLLSRCRCRYRSYHPFVRRHSLLLASCLSLLAGAAKEAADHFGFFRSSGASSKDAAADVVGVFIAAFLLSLYNYYSSDSSKSKIDETDTDTDIDTDTDTATSTSTSAGPGRGRGRGLVALV